MKWTVYLLIASIAGCASTPGEIVETGARNDLVGNGRPAEVARCIARNAEAISGNIAATERESAGIYEVIVRSTGEASGAIAVARVGPAVPGSSIAVWVTPNMLANPKGYAERLAKGC